ncbi:MAG: MTH938/NDUFAF3 family protein [Caldisericaceae bacterium]
MKHVKRKFIILIIILGIVSFWFIFNPIGKISIHSFGFTVYSGIPYPYADLIVDSSSIFPRIRETKSHWISEEEFYKIIGNKLDAWPEYVIIGTGYEDRVKVSPGILTRGANPIIKILPTPKAIELFNKLKSEGKRVIIIMHSTC